MSSPADIFGDEDFLKTLSYLDLTAKFTNRANTFRDCGGQRFIRILCFAVQRYLV